MSQTCPVATALKATRSPRSITESSVFMRGHENTLWAGRNTQKNGGRGESPLDQSGFTRFFHKTTLHGRRVTFVQ